MKVPSPTLAEEEKLWRKSEVMIGVDEVGRGPLAGPVLAVALMLEAKNQDDIADIVALGIRDSKTVTPKKRERIFETLANHPRVRWAAGEADEATIDAINILQASLLAMRRAALALLEKHPVVPERVRMYVDGRDVVPDLTLNQTSIIDGDAKIFSISCASIIAKVLRDRKMAKYAEQYPQYEFTKHKGYGTKRHFALITEYGVSPIHRKSFLKKRAR